MGSATTVLLVATFVVGSTAQAVTVAPRLTNRVILAKSLDNMGKAKSVMVIGNVRASETRTYNKSYYANQQPRAASFSAEFSSFFDATDEQHPKALVTLNSFQVQDGEEAYRGGEVSILVDDKVGYLYLDVFSSLPKDLFDYSALEKKWLRIDEKTFASFAEEELDFSKQWEKSRGLTEGQKKQILKAMQRYNVLLITRAKDEKLDGVDSYHLQLKLNRGTFVSFLNQVNKIVDGKYMTRSEVTELRKEVAKAKLPTLDVWVDKAELLPRKFAVNYRQKEMSSFGTTILTAGLTMNFSNYNNLPAPITAPAQSEDFMVVFNRMLDEIDKKRNFTATTSFPVTLAPVY